MTTLFIDEGKRQGYLLVAATIADGDAGGLRKAVTALRTPGSERLHFVRESDGRKRKVLGELARLGVRTTVMQANGLDDRAARAWCLEQVVEFAAAVGADRIVIETDDSIVLTDNRTLFQALGARDLRERVRYEHRRAASEPLLWLPDAVAWSYGRGGHWGALVAPIIERVLRNDA